MKTAISVPDGTFDAAAHWAAELGISRSEFFAVAAKRYVSQLETESLTEEINAALAASGADDSGDFAVSVGRARLADDDW